METINVDQLMVEIRQEVARQVSRRKSKPTAVVQRSTDAAGLRHLVGALGHVEAVLNLAESRSHVRTQLPDKFQKSPLSAGKKFMLKVFNLAFRDQREVNAGLIEANRHSNQINRQIIEELSSIRTQLNQIQVHLDRQSQP
ncbi:MAG: hypothetical protein HC860_03040 [Alkalinema sp. RU_4_3]|nr:hypothetical protein [Alkalinema sp. RU_4_3]